MTPAEYFFVIAALYWVGREWVHQVQRKQDRGQR